MSSSSIFRRLLLNHDARRHCQKSFISKFQWRNIFTHVPTNYGPLTAVKVTRISSCFQTCSSNTVQVRHKGHSHFQNVRHIKDAMDREKMQVIQKLTVAMAAAIRDGGGADPKFNGQLADVIARMEKRSIPKAKIKSILEKMKESGKNLQNLYIDVRGPKGIVFVVEVLSNNSKMAKDLLRSVIKKVPGVSLPEQSQWEHMFEKVGEIIVPITKEMNAGDMDHYVEVAIEAGAQDVIVVKNNDESIETETVLKFHCEPKMISHVSKEIEETHNLPVSSSEVNLIPNMYAALESEEDIQIVEQFLTKIGKVEQVMRVYDNLATEEED